MLRYIALGLTESKRSADNLSEEYSRDADMPHFAVLSANGEQIGPWMKCKDYIQDTIWGAKEGKSCEVYGFSYNHGTDPVAALDRLNLALRWPGKTQTEMAKMLINTKKVVENLEKRLDVPKFKRTRFSRAIGDTFVISGSPVWLRSSQTVSFFSFLIRSSLLNKTGMLETSKDSAPVKKDVYYLLSGKKFIEKLIGEGINSIPSNWEDTTANALHNGGFVAYSSSALGGKVYYQGEDVQDEDWDF